MMKAWYEEYIPLHTNGRDLVPGLTISGYIILGVSIYLKVSRNGNVIMDEEVPFDLLIAAGVIIMVLGFLGCCGAIKENRCMLILAIEMLLALVMTCRIQKASSAEVTMALTYRNATNMEMATTPQAPPMLPATQAPPMLPATQAPPMLPATQAPPMLSSTQAPPMLPATQAPPMLPATQAHLHASAYYPPPPPYQYDGKN
ncbi:disintegrin and metalloproteinase domain-containing protein 29 isoform X2 [Salmo trutta]|nr:disintegrin and metalloproteinase domain-containing protein 29-like isoform X2 [Salmo trutta]